MNLTATPAPSAGSGTSAERLRVGFSITVDRDRIAALEAMAVDSIWVGGHVAAAHPSDEALIGLARLAALTEHAAIGTSILLLPLYAPAIVAKQVADLDSVSGGRVRLGIGVGGEHPQEFRACMVPVEERGSRTDEMIPLLRQLWTAEVISHKGLYYAMDDVRIQPPPRQPGGPPIIVSGRAPAAIRRAALLGDGWMPYLYSSEKYAASVRSIHTQAQTAGRDLSRFEWTAFLFVSVHQDSQVALEAAARFLPPAFHHALPRVVLAGPPDVVARQAQAFVDAGARHLIFLSCSVDDPGSIDRAVMEDVVPRLRPRPVTNGRSLSDST